VLKLAYKWIDRNCVRWWENRVSDAVTHVKLKGASQTTKRFPLRLRVRGLNSSFVT